VFKIQNRYPEILFMDTRLILKSNEITLVELIHAARLYQVNINLSLISEPLNGIKKMKCQNADIELIHFSLKNFQIKYMVP
jgi:hypothetical protein